MKKLTLSIDELDVKSFETAAAGDEQRGTVQGNEMADSGPWYCFGTWVCSTMCPPAPVDV